MGWFHQSLLIAQADAAAVPDVPAAEGWSFPYAKLLIVVAVFAASFGLGRYLSRRWRMPDYFGKITLILFTLFAGAAVCLNAAYLKYVHAYLTYVDQPPYLKFVQQPPVDKIKLGIDLRGGVILVYELLQGEETTFAPGQEADGGRRGADGKASVDMDRLVTAIKRRIDPANIKEVTVRPLGSQQIEIIIPKVEKEEVDRIRKILGSIGTLEFRILATRRDANYDYGSLIDRGLALPDSEKRLRETDPEGKERTLAFWVPVEPGKEGQFEGSPDLGKRWVTTRRGKKHLEVLVVQDDQDVTGAYLTRAKPGVDEQLRPAVNFAFNAAGAERFGKLTGTHLPDKVGKYEYQLGIILDGKLQSAPGIRDAIFGSGEITGDFTEQAVKEYVDVLNAGALPTALSPEPVSQQFIGPTLGEDTIRRGMNSIVLSVALVLMFMLAYYRFAGVVACLALFMNMILLLAIMITIQAAFTLPGLAGFALTVGMAVDANVLIYERMREEAARGAALRMTIRNGFDRALSAIVDSNLTTLITALVLYVIGTDQVRGFAVTLFLGIVLSMYTAIFCAHVVFDVAERRRWISSVKMLKLVGETHFNFLRYKWWMIGMTLGLIVLGMAGVVHRGRGLLGIDFSGGVSIQFAFNQKHDIADVRDRLEEANLPDTVVSDVQSERAEPGTQFKVETSSPPGVDAEQYLRQVQAKIEEIFDKAGELQRNQVKVTLLAAEAPAKETGPGERAPPGKAGPPKAESQGGLGLPPGSRGQTVALSSILLAGASPADKASEKSASSAAPPAEGPGKSGNEAPPPLAKPAAGGAPPAAPAASGAGTKAKMKFDVPVNHRSLETAFQQATESVMGTGQALEPTLSNDKYEEGSTVSYDEWDVELPLPADQARKVLAAVENAFESTPVFPSSNTVGGAVAEITRYRAIYALLASTLAILVYLWVRFQRISYGLGAIASLVHDTILALGFVALSYHLAEIPFVTRLLLIEPFKLDLTVMTALLTLAGYSLNDTIVIFDRIREVRGKSPHVTEEMVNLSINQTLSRTILTGLSTLLVILTLYVLGGATIHGFAFAMFIGIITGTYSSIYIASPFLLWIAGRQETARWTRT